MAGPTASVLVPTALRDDDIRAAIEGAFHVVHSPFSMVGQCHTIMDSSIDDGRFLIAHGEEYEGSWHDLHRA